jgi:hypothetical protein
MSNDTNTEATEATPNELTAAEQKKSQLVNFVANNILNSLTLNQSIQVVQQVALRDANTIISEADESKLKEIEDAYSKATQGAEATTEQEATAKAPGKKAPAKKAKARKTAKKATA